MWRERSVLSAHDVYGGLKKATDLMCKRKDMPLFVFTFKNKTLHAYLCILMRQTLKPSTFTTQTV